VKKRRLGARTESLARKRSAKSASGLVARQNQSDRIDREGGLEAKT